MMEQLQQKSIGFFIILAIALVGLGILFLLLSRITIRYQDNLRKMGHVFFVLAFIPFVGILLVMSRELSVNWLFKIVLK